MGAELLVDRFMVSKSVRDLYRLPYGNAAHSLLLDTLDLESSLAKPGPCVVSENTRHSLMGIATFDPVAEEYWALVLGKDWNLRRDVLRTATERSRRRM